MKIHSLIQIVVLLGVQSAMALPVTNPNPTPEDYEAAGCSHNSQYEDFRDLIQKSSVIGKDDRKLLSKNLDVVGFSPAEQEQAMRCMGRIYCPGGRDMALMQTAGAVCAPGARDARGRCAADRLATVRHLFVDKKTNRFVAKMEKCEFRSFRGHVSMLEIDDIKSSDPSVETNNPHKNSRADKVAVRLKRPIPGCDPYDLPDSSAAPEAGTEVIALTHPQEDQAGLYDGNEPLAYPCQVTRSFAGRGGGPALFYTDCDLNGVGSGGFSLVRNRSGRWAVGGIFVGAGALSKNGMPYSESTDPAVKNFTLSIGTNEDFLRMISNPGVKTDPLIRGDILGK